MPLVHVYYRVLGREFHHDIKLTNDEVRKNANGILRCMDCGKLQTVESGHPC